MTGKGEEQLKSSHNAGNLTESLSQPNREFYREPPFRAVQVGWERQVGLYALHGPIFG